MLSALLPRSPLEAELGLHSGPVASGHIFMVLQQNWQLLHFIPYFVKPRWRPASTSQTVAGQPSLMLTPPRLATGGNKGQQKARW